MSPLPVLKRLLAFLSVVGLVMITYLLSARPYQLRWGATDEEVKRPMPGDELDSSPTFLATRAITIEGSPEQIWPWLVQMGYGRAGFYGYDIVENLGSTQGIQSADHILPEFQNFKVGDPVPISAVARTAFYAIEPNRYLIWSGGPGKGGFTWALYRIDESHTRLVSRIRWTHHWTQPDLLALDLFTEFTDHLAVRKVLQGLKGRVEGRVEPMAPGTFEVAIYAGAALIFFISVLLIILGPLTWLRWLAGLAGGAVWLIVWYGPISIWIGALLELVIIVGMFQAFRRA